MKIYFSPYFSGHPFVDIKANSARINEKCAGKCELLSQIELRLGMSHREVDVTEERLKEYHSILNEVISKDHLLRKSFEIDGNDKYPVTTAILKWRDTLILAGWDGNTDLKGDKLKVISNAEKMIQPDSIIHLGEADRWLALSKASLSPIPLKIEAVCPRVLIEPLILKVLDRLKATYTFNANHNKTLNTKKALIVSADDVTDAYRCLAHKKPRQGEVVVCRDPGRLDCVLRSFHQPTAGAAEVGCHRIIADPRDLLDFPDTMIWLDCNGDYGLQYPYDFMSSDEIDEIRKGIIADIPTKQDMLSELQNHLIHSLNSVKNNVVYVTSKRDRGSILPEHPQVTWLKHNNVKTHDVKSLFYVAMKPGKAEEIRFARQEEYRLNSCDAFPKDVVMSYSSLEKLFQTPFDFVVERQCIMKDISDVSDITTLIGNIAHKVIELMVDDNKAISLTDYDTYFANAVKEVDEEKLFEKSENTFILQEFRNTLMKSIETLSDIITTNGLTVVASEMKIPNDDKKNGVNIDDIGLVKGTIDLVLKNNNDKYFIFDFKYSRSDSYSDKLADNRSVQFELYHKLFDQHSRYGKIKAMGYYLFPLATLFMSERDYIASGFTGDNIVSVPLDRDATNNPWDAIVRSFEFRKFQLQKGVIEEGEGMEIESFEYSKEGDLLPLKHEYNKEKLKASAYSPKHIVLKNQIR